MKRIISLTASCFVAAACGGVENETPLADELTAALELDDGGISLEDESPSFSIEGTDGSDLEVAQIHYKVAAGWKVDALSGTWQVNRGTLELRGVIGFDGPSDEVDVVDASTIQFQSLIFGHNDGLLIRVVAPQDDTPLLLTLTTDGGKQVVFDLAEIEGAPRIHERPDGSKLGAVAKRFGGEDVGD